MDMLLKKGAILSYHYPHVSVVSPMRRYPNLRMSSHDLTVDHLQTQDCVLIVTNHSDYNWSWIAQHSSLVVEPRNAMKCVVAPGDRAMRAYE
jgi:UDP-N-acetyl-D-glucosamine dehydrogenase